MVRFKVKNFDTILFWIELGFTVFDMKSKLTQHEHDLMTQPVRSIINYDSYSLTTIANIGINYNSYSLMT